MTVLRLSSKSTLFPYTTLFRSRDRVRCRIEIDAAVGRAAVVLHAEGEACVAGAVRIGRGRELEVAGNDVGNRDQLDRKSTRLNSSHGYISYAVFCLNKKLSKLP